MEMYSTYNEGKSVVAERFIRTLKNMTIVSKSVYFDVMVDIVDKYNITHHKTIKMKPIDVKSDSYAEYNVNSNQKYPKLKIGHHVRIPKYKNIFGKGYAPNWLEEVCVIGKIKYTVQWNYGISDFNGEQIIGIFYEK